MKKKKRQYIFFKLSASSLNYLWRKNNLLGSILNSIKIMLVFFTRKGDGKV